MKPNEARVRHRTLELARQARSENLEAYIRHGRDVEEVRPELIPTAGDLREADRALRQALHEVERRDRGDRRRVQLMDTKVIPLMARVVYLERVMALDPLMRAGLRPSQLVALSMIKPEHLRTKLGELRRAA